MTGSEFADAVATTGSAGAAGVVEAAACKAGFDSLRSGWIEALASAAAPPPVSLASRACSFARSALEAESGCVACQGRRRICAPPYRRPVTALVARVAVQLCRC